MAEYDTKVADLADALENFTRAGDDENARARALAHLDLTRQEFLDETRGDASPQVQQIAQAVSAYDVTPAMVARTDRYRVHVADEKYPILAKIRVYRAARFLSNWMSALVVTAVSMLAIAACLALESFGLAPLSILFAVLGATALMAIAVGGEDIMIDINAKVNPPLATIDVDKLADRMRCSRKDILSIDRENPEFAQFLLDYDESRKNTPPDIEKDLRRRCAALIRRGISDESTHHLYRLRNGLEKR